MELNDETIKNLSDVDDKIDNEEIIPRYKSVNMAIKGVGTTVASMASGAVGQTLGLPTDIYALGAGIKDAIFADEGKGMEAFSKTFSEVSKENLGSEYYKENFNTLINSLIDDDLLKEDAKSGFVAGQFAPVPTGVSALVNTAKVAKTAISQKEATKAIIDSLSLPAKAVKNLNIEKLGVDGALNLAKQLRVAR